MRNNSIYRISFYPPYIPDHAQYLSVNQQYNVKKYSKFP